MSPMPGRGRTVTRGSLDMMRAVGFLIWRDVLQTDHLAAVFWVRRNSPEGAGMPG